MEWKETNAGEGMETISSYRSIQSLGVIYSLIQPMKTNTIINIVLIWLIIIWFWWWTIAQSNANKAEEIIELDKQIMEADYQIYVRQQNYKIHMDAAAECEESFYAQAQKEHEEADEYRATKEELEIKKAGLISNR